MVKAIPEERVSKRGSVPVDRIKDQDAESVDVLVPQMTGGGTVEVIQPLPAQHIKDRIADQIVHIPVPLVMEELVAAVQEDRRANCGGAHSTNHGGRWRRVQICTTGAMFGKDLRTDRGRPYSAS